MQVFLKPLSEMEEFRLIKNKLKKNVGVLEVTGCIESQKSHIIYGLGRDYEKKLVIAENDLKAKQFFEDYSFYDREVFFYPAKDILFYQADIHGNLLMKERLFALKQVIDKKSVTIVTSVTACMDSIMSKETFLNRCLHFKNDSLIDLDELSKNLVDMGYERAGQVEESGQFAFRGGIVDIYPLTEDNPVRIELWGDEIDSIRSFDVESQRSIENLEEITIYPANDEAKGQVSSLIDYFESTKDLVCIDEPNRILDSAFVTEDEFEESFLKRPDMGHIFGSKEIIHKINRHNTLAISALEFKKGDWKVTEKFALESKSVNPYNNSFELLIADLKSWKKKGYRVVLLSASKTRADRLAGDLRNEDLPAFYGQDAGRTLQEGEIMVMQGHAHRGFEYPLLKFIVLTESDIFGKAVKKKRKRSDYGGKRISSFSELSIGDYVVHENHGLGIYRGIEKVNVEGVEKDYIKIEYEKKSNLYILATQLEALQKYASSDAKKPKLNRLGGAEWKKTKSRVKTAVETVAKDLVELYASRQESSGYAFGQDTVWQREFEEMFPYEETQDQLLAIEDTKKDMESTKIMDRLICGDVGYGKTEIAIRAAFKAIQEGKQVVYLTPTTILAQQIYNTFVQRMKDFPVRVDLMCRFRSSGEIKKTVEDLKKGWVDVVVGTHRVLSKDVIFKDLGLLIIDEEQRFGVAHKEKIKKLKTNVDVLTLTATPIPRTLHMSLVGIRDMSVLKEPPMDRLPIQTYIMEHSEEVVREAISRELSRGGQVYYVYNRVETIAEVAGKIAALLPEADVAYAHGQMKEQELEKIMYAFINGEIDVLVSTTIIETGLDISNVNTIIIHDADKMGLSQLYQLRGRVGRSNRIAYAFLMYQRNKMLKEVAEKRLMAIREYTELGSGFKIAMRDLEIRGAGNLLGEKQSGHMEAVGYNLYCKMLNEAVKMAKGIDEVKDFDTVIDMNINAYIPETYILNEAQKLDIYKRIAGIENQEEMEEMFDELMDRFGEPGKSVRNLLEIAGLKALAHKVYVTEVKQMTDTLKITFYEKAKLDVTKFADVLSVYGDKITFKTKEALEIYYKPGNGNKKQEVDMMECAGEFLERLRQLL
ncbi:MAG TPA: transcription-repair coupling factor [Lachnospiraceae bacterium]